ncbi:MAG: peptide-methionine (S)-S-oxide reductase MsrA [Thermoanaerobaculia bacterium]
MLKRAIVGGAIVAVLLILAGVFLRSEPAEAQKATPRQVAKATFAGGCFWCMEPPFDKMDGVLSTTSGYTGGTEPNPSYESVSRGGTGHYEAVQVLYDPTRVSFEQLLETYWRNIDPFDASGQFCDKGKQYRAAIFYHDEEQQSLAETSRDRVEKQLAQSVVTEILPAQTYYAAEEYHQDYYRKNPIRYKFYRTGCGRDGRLEAVWGAVAK